MTSDAESVKNKKSDAAILVVVLIIFGLVLGGFGLAVLITISALRQKNDQSVQG